MSLINDALKRAKQAQKENPTPTPALAFRSAEPSPRRSSGLSPLMMVGMIALVAFAGLVAALAWLKPEPRPAVAHASQPRTSQLQEGTLSGVGPAPDSVPAAPIAPAPPQPQPTPVAESPAPSNTDAVAEMPPAMPAATNLSESMEATTEGTEVVAEPPPPKPALPKLQGIFYRPERPSAVINGKNVYIGNRLGEFQVLAIARETVTIGSATETNILSLE